MSPLHRDSVPAFGYVCAFRIPLAGSLGEIEMADKTLTLASVSWIDGRNLPPVGFGFIAGAGISWPRRVIMGLVGTANPEPPADLSNIAKFRSDKQFRALTGLKLVFGFRPMLYDPLLDPGYTPPLDRSKFDQGIFAQAVAYLAPIPDDPAFYPGEKSNLSRVALGRLHPASGLHVPAGAEVIVSTLIKFRAGTHTDTIGVSEAKSPVHVPWVWCEYALVRHDGELRLLAQGSAFPSHKWYVNGKQVAVAMQQPVSVSDKDPTITTGQPRKEIQSRSDTDRSNGPVNAHDYAVGPGKLINLELPGDLV
jgi:hypothetical protein